ncbi:argininosuccinate lyase [Candidatus Aerophobetes bacterium]|nr:argininosuccinate lyase [Candidatus Aerophobetes bacterium]
MSLWSGRFSKELHPLVKKFTFSAKKEKRILKHDIEGSKAHARMLAECGIIKKEEAERIIKSLDEIKSDIEKGKIDLSEKEDIHMAVEEELIKREKEAGEKLHTARSRNDQIALDERLYLKEEINLIYHRLCNLQSVFLKLARENRKVIIPGLTHLQYAQPVSLAHHLLAYFWMLERDKKRLKDCYRRIDVSPLGSGAIAGTSLPIDRKLTAKILGFSDITENSIDSVSDRDFMIEFLACCSIIMMHLSRLCEELILWSSPFFEFMEIDDSFSTGSSLMPHKKNPDVLELIRGKTGKVYGALFSLLTIMKALPLSYNRDMQEDKSSLFETTDEVKICLEVLAEFLKHINFCKEKMRKKAEEGLFFATDLVEYLVEKGVPFRKAHRKVGEMVRWCLENKKDLKSLTLDEYKKFSPLFDEDVKKRLDISVCVENKDSKGGTGKKSLEEQIKLATKILERENEVFSLPER